MSVLFSAVTLTTGLVAPTAFSDEAQWPSVGDALGVPLTLEATIPLPDVAGRIDHMAVDLASHRLAVAELGNDSVDIIDLNAARVIHRIADLKAPQGVVFSPAADTLVVANADDGSVRFFGATDFAPLDRIDLGDDADDVRLDASTGHIVVGYGNGGLAVIDAAKRTKLAAIPLPAHPEGFELAPDGRRAFVNLPDGRQIAIVDMTAGRQIASWPTKELRSNFPMAIDATGTTLAVVFRGPSELVLFDTRNGTQLANSGTCGDADDVFFDERRQRIYISCGEGVVDVLERNGSAVRRVAQVNTSAGARTALFVPEFDRLFVAARATAGNDAKILIFRPTP